MTPDEAKKLPNQRIQKSVLSGLSDYLKDPANYFTVEKQLLETLASTHSHGDVLEWGNCVPCLMKLQKRAELMKKLGFKSVDQYMAWKKIHQVIRDRVPFPKYNKPI